MGASSSGGRHPAIPDLFLYGGRFVTRYAGFRGRGAGGIPGILADGKRPSKKRGLCRSGYFGAVTPSPKVDGVLLVPPAKMPVVYSPFLSVRTTIMLTRPFTRSPVLNSMLLR